MRLIDADALLEAIYKIYGANHAPQGIINLITNAPTIQREGWVSTDVKKPDQLEVKIKLIDGSEIYAWYQSDGDYYWNCGGREIFIEESNVTHWIPAAPTETE